MPIVSKLFLAQLIFSVYLIWTKEILYTEELHGILWLYVLNICFSLKLTVLHIHIHTIFYCWLPILATLPLTYLSRPIFFVFFINTFIFFKSIERLPTSSIFSYHFYRKHVSSVCIFWLSTPDLFTFVAKETISFPAYCEEAFSNQCGFLSFFFLILN